MINASLWKFGLSGKNTNGSRKKHVHAAICTVIVKSFLFNVIEGFSGKLGNLG
jgi:hypothetical protein